MWLGRWLWVEQVLEEPKEELAEELLYFVRMERVNDWRISFAHENVDVERYVKHER